MLDSTVARREVEPGRRPLVIAEKTGAVVHATKDTCGTMQTDLAPMVADPLGSGLILDHSQNRTVAAKAITER